MAVCDMITWIRIQNFRSLVDVSVDLDPLTVLIGLSGTGKSNFVDAIRFLRDSLNDRNMNAMKLGGVHRLLHVDHLNEPLGFHVRFTVSKIEEPFEYRLYVRPDDMSTRILEEYLNFGGKLLFHQEETRWVHPPAVQPPPAAKGIMLGAIPGLQESTFAYVALRSGIGCYDFPGDVLTRQQNQLQPTDQGFLDRGENYLGIAARILSDLNRSHSWRQIARSLKAVNRAVASLTLNVPNPDKLYIGYQLNGRTPPIEVSQESEGLRRFLAQMMALYQNPSKQTLLFEHPEAGLHPGALESLAREFNSCSQDQRGQVILTTHSPQLLDCFSPESLRVVEIEKMETRIGPVAPEQMESLREKLLHPGELLTVDPARLPGDLAEVPE
jgi:predicted ATPase